MNRPETQSAPHRIIFGDARHMTEIDDAAVQLIVTSPPYWQLKDYGAPAQIGFHESYQDYIASLNQVWAECYRVLHDGCRMCVNIGDQFARAAHYGRYKVIPIREQIVRGCEALGFDYMGAIIWQKATTMNSSGGGAVMGSFPYPRNGILKIDYEFILLFKKLGTAPKVSKEQKSASAMTNEEWNRNFSGYWNFAGEKQGGGHIARFPLELPRRLIQMFSFQGETVLDPFSGSGTTIRAAMEAERTGIGYEINPEFQAAIKQRLGLEQGDLFGSRNVVFSESNNPCPPERQWRVDVAGNGLQRQIDPKQHRFGSVIDGNDEENAKPKGQRVRQVLAPDKLRLENDGEIQLLGIETIDNKAQNAVSYLESLLLNKAVFLKFDEDLQCNGTPRAYVYLANKTFINAKLIKRGLCRADAKVAHRYSRRFQGYETQEMIKLNRSN